MSMVRCSSNCRPLALVWQGSKLSLIISHIGPDPVRILVLNSLASLILPQLMLSWSARVLSPVHPQSNTQHCKWTLLEYAVP